MHTERRAKMLWCPMADPVAESRCKASGCAVWQESPHEAAQPGRRFIECPDRAALKEPEQRPRRVDQSPAWEFRPYDPDEGDPAGWLEPADEYQLRRLGYCGLAPLHKG